jgi:hypothetical protein
MADNIQVDPGNPNPHTERSVGWWQEEIKRGLLYQELYGRPQEWRRYRGYYRHQWTPGTAMPVNMVFSIIRSMIPQVYFHNPRVFVTAQKPGMELHARTVEATDNQLIREMGLKKQIKRIIQDAGIQGSGVIWRGYDSEYGWDPTKLDPTTGDSTLTFLDKRGYRIEYNAYVAPGMPWALRAELESTIFPWGTRDVKNAPWVAMRVLRPLDDVKSDPKYRNTGSLTPVRLMPQSGGQDEYSKILERVEYAEMWQIRDVKTGEIVVVAIDHPHFLRREEDEMQIDGVPFHWFVFNDDPVFPWGIPDARIMEPQQLELNETRKLAMYHRRVAIVKALVKKGAIKKEEMDKLLDEDVKAMVNVESEGSIREAVEFVNSQIPQDLHAWAELIRGDIREVTGYGRNQLGVAQGDRTTATEARLVSGAHEIRVDERRDLAADLLEEIMRGVNQTIFKFWTTRRVVQVVGPSGLPGWIEYTGEELRGEYNYRIDPNNGAPVSGVTRKQDAAQLLQLWAGIGKGAPPPPELSRYIFSSYEGINVEALVSQLSALFGQNVAGLPGGSPENPASLQQALRGGAGVSPAFASAGAPAGPPAAPVQL